MNDETPHQTAYEGCATSNTHPLRRAGDYFSRAGDLRERRGNGKAPAAGDVPTRGRRRIDGSTADQYEKHWRVWKLLLERQSVATLLGAFLLVSMFLYISVAALGGVVVPSLVGNAFLLILGYFFGQAGSSSSGHDS